MEWVGFWPTVIFRIHNLFIKGYDCVTQGSCWFFVPTVVQGCVILGPNCGKPRWSLRGHAQLYWDGHEHPYSFKWQNQRKSWKSWILSVKWLVKAMNSKFHPLEGHSRSWKPSFRGFRGVFVEFWAEFHLYKRRLQVVTGLENSLDSCVLCLKCMLKGGIYRPLKQLEQFWEIWIWKSVLGNWMGPMSNGCIVWSDMSSLLDLWSKWLPIVLKVWTILL